MTDNLVDEIFKLNDELTSSIKLLRKHGTELAQCESEYKLKLRIEALKLRQEKNMPVTLINQIIYGVPEVNELRLKRDIAQVTYDTNLEHINVTKLKIRILEAQVNREWGVAGRGEI